MLLTNARALICLTLATAAVGGATGTAEAAFPGIDGRFAYTEVGGGGSDFTIWAVNPDGTGREMLASNEGNDFNPRWSPDSKKLAYTNHPEDGDSEIRLYDWAAQTDVPLTNDDASQTYATWHPDGTHIVYAEGGDIWQRSADPSSAEPPVNLTQTDSVNETEPAMKPDGTKLVYVEDAADGDVRVKDLTSGIVTNITNNSDDERKPQWHPTEDKLTYSREIVENQQLNHEIYVISAAGGGVGQRITTDAFVDFEPVWAPSGTKVAWRGGRTFGNQAAFARIWTAGPAGANPAPISATINAFQMDWGSNLSPHGVTDSDGDGVADSTDNCKDAVNPGQQDTYGDARGDACEPKPLVKEEPKKDEPKQETPKQETPKQAGTAKAPAPKTAPAPAPASAEMRADNLVVASTRSCASRRQFTIRLRIPRGAKVASGTATVTANGKSHPAKFVNGRHRANVDLRNLPKGRFAVKIVVKTDDGRTVTTTRRYRTCTAGAKKKA